MTDGVPSSLECCRAMMPRQFRSCYYVLVVSSSSATPSHPQSFEGSSLLPRVYTLDCCLAIAFVLVRSSLFLVDDFVPSPSADCCTLSFQRLLHPIPRSIVAPSLVLAFSYPLPRPIAVPSYPSTSHSYRCCTRSGRTVRSQEGRAKI